MTRILGGCGCCGEEIDNCTDCVNRLPNTLKLQLPDTSIVDLVYDSGLGYWTSGVQTVIANKIYDSNCVSTGQPGDVDVIYRFLCPGVADELRFIIRAVTCIDNNIARPSPVTATDRQIYGKGVPVAGNCGDPLNITYLFAESTALSTLDNDADDWPWNVGDEFLVYEP